MAMAPVYFTKLARTALVSVEARTPSCAKECVTCGQTFEQMMYILFSLREERQWVCCGWLCFDCHRKHLEEGVCCSLE